MQYSEKYHKMVYDRYIKRRLRCKVKADMTTVEEPSHVSYAAMMITRGLHVTLIDRRTRIHREVIRG